MVLPTSNVLYFFAFVINITGRYFNFKLAMDVYSYPFRY